MTSDAAAAQGSRGFAFGRFLLVATLARHFAVLTVEPIGRTLIVVEVPQRPGAGVVATLATRTKLLLVLVFLLVTGKTIAWRVLETGALVTALASGRDVPTGQREACQPMVKLGDAPRTIIMTLLTCGARLSFMLVIFFMATQAVNRGLAHAAQVLVAGRTLDRGRGMCVTQRKLGPIVVEATRGVFPIALSMAIGAFFTQAGVVLVVFLVASDAFLGRFLEHGAFVATLALHFGVLAQQGKTALGMVKLGGLLPTPLTVTTGAVFSQ